MAISEKRYAAEFIDSDGQVFKFDDFGCMRNFIKQKRSISPVQATFVMDFDQRQWIKAENAYYVRSSEFQTPMNGGIVAFKDQSNGQAAAAKYHGAMFGFAEVMK
jgi:copper chaperone NosL